MKTSNEIDSNTVDVDRLSSGSIIWEIILNCANLLLLSFGTFIQLKIISICQREKEKTWQIDIIHSVGMMTLFLFGNMFERLTDYFPDFEEYTGVWMCYIAALIYTYGSYIMGFHSLVVSSMKYVFIVHQRRVMEIGEKKIKKIFLWITILHPLLLTIPTIHLFDFEIFLSIIKCFGLKDQLVAIYSTTTGPMERMFMCKLNIAENAEKDSPIAYTLQQGFCSVKMVWVLVLTGNLPEAYLYHRIFKTMQR